MHYKEVIKQIYENKEFHKSISKARRNEKITNPEVNTLSMFVSNYLGKQVREIATEHYPHRVVPKMRWYDITFTEMTIDEYKGRECWFYHTLGNFQYVYSNIERMYKNGMFKICDPELLIFYIIVRRGMTFPTTSDGKVKALSQIVKESEDNDTVEVFHQWYLEHKHEWKLAPMNIKELKQRRVDAGVVGGKSSGKKRQKIDEDLFEKIELYMGIDVEGNLFRSKGMSISALAKLCGISRPTLYRAIEMYSNNESWEQYSN